MLGKTNIIYVEKDQGSDMQFVTEYITTKAVNGIEKIWCLEDVFFVRITENYTTHMLYGKDINNLDYLKYGDDMLEVTDVQYFKGKYIFYNRTEVFQQKKEADPLELSYYTTSDLVTLEERKLAITMKNNGVLMNGLILGAEINSDKNLIFLCLRTVGSSSDKLRRMTYVMQTLDEWNSEGGKKEVESSETTHSLTGKSVVTFMRDKFLIEFNEENYHNLEIVTIDGTLLSTRHSDLNFNWPEMIKEDIAYYIVSSKLYYSINFSSQMLLRSDPTSKILMIGDKIGLCCPDGTLLIADSFDNIRAEKFTELQVKSLSDYTVLCWASTDEGTYLGCSGGIITKIFLDADGTYQKPEVLLVKTLAAKQALFQANAYTDQQYKLLEERIAELETRMAGEET